MAEEKDNPQVSTKVIGMALAVYTVFVSSVPVAVNKLVPEVRYKPFTSDDGNELSGRVDILDLQIDQIMETDKECQERQEMIEARYHDHVLNGHPESVQREIESLRKEIHYYFGGKRGTQ